MKREKSQQAQVAAIIKKALKADGINCRASSDSFAGGDSVTIHTTNIPAPKLKEIREKFGVYQYGHFDGMNDIYEYSNSNNDIPQTKYLHINCEYTPEIKQAAWDWVKNNFNNEEVEAAPDKYEDLHSYFKQILGRWASDVVFCVLNDSFFAGSIEKTFWDDYTNKTDPEPTDPEPTDPNNSNKDGITVSLNDDKKGVEVSFTAKPSEAIRNTLKGAGFRWSRNKGFWYAKQTPETLKIAESLSGSKPEDQAPALGSSLELKESKPALQSQLDLKRAEKLKALADNLQPKINHAFGDRLQNTPKRVAQAANARLEGVRLERCQLALNRLAEAYTAGSVPRVLEGITGKAQILELLSSKTQQVANGYHGYSVDSGEPRYDTPEALALWDLVEEKQNSRADSLELETLQAEVRFANIAGYFSTPRKVIDQLLEHVDLFPGCSVLEPEAGSGAICDAVKEREPAAKITAFEVNHSLCKILRLKGHTVDQQDFLLNDEPGSYDFVIQNPPFERQADIDHIRRGFSKLKPGGRLVSILSPGPFYRDNRKSVEFREWLDALGGEKYELPKGSFKESGTSIDTVYIVIDKPELH